MTDKINPQSRTCAPAADCGEAVQQQSGRLVVVDGCEGAGKTTQINYIASLFDSLGIDFIVTREPGGSVLGDQIRQILLETHSEEIDPLAELLLFFAARAQHLSKLIFPALKKGTWVLCDRFTDSSYAYQGEGRLLGEEPVRILENLVQKEFRPDLCLFLNLTFGLGQKRIKIRRGSADDIQVDRFETETSEFHRRIQRAYLQRAEQNPIRNRIIPAAGGVLEVQQRLKDELLQFIASCENK